MIKRLLLVVVMGVTLSGCFMAPLALIGPMSSGFTTASIIDERPIRLKKLPQNRYCGSGIRA